MLRFVNWFFYTNIWYDMIWTTMSSDTVFNSGYFPSADWSNNPTGHLLITVFPVTSVWRLTVDTRRVDIVVIPSLAM